LPLHRQRKPRFNLRTVIGRAEYLVHTVRLYFEGWTIFDGNRATRFLDCVRVIDWNDETLVLGEEFKFIHEWLSDHNQSLDWLMVGDPMVYIGKRAEESEIAKKPRATQ
jgi:hypothetical protein